MQNIYDGRKNDFQLVATEKLDNNKDVKAIGQKVDSIDLLVEEVDYLALSPGT